MHYVFVWTAGLAMFAIAGMVGQEVATGGRLF